MNINAAFDWKCQPEAEQFILNIVDQAIQKNKFVDQLQKDLLEKTSTRLFDWLDHVTMPHSQDIEDKLIQIGFRKQIGSSPEPVYHHLGAQLPRVVLKNNNLTGIAVIVDFISEFLLLHGGLGNEIEGSPYSAYRKSMVSNQNEIVMWVVERRGTSAVEPCVETYGYIERYFKSYEAWSNRKRNSKNEDQAMDQALILAKDLVERLGKDPAASLVLEIERKYWQGRNTAGQLQKNRQDRLGLGWANHDHHTFRSSRRHFRQLVHLFEILGFQCRERYYAGQEAGWGAQIMENPVCRLVLFLDVDLAPHEIGIDFAHTDLGDLPQLGTIGLWCALHGDSILNAGMHHLEAQFMFDELAQDLKKSGVDMMNPFSNFPYLKQAFTKGEIWPVDKEGVEKLVREGKLSEEQGKKFIENGALGSHLENLQRREGYKGFNQKNVSIIIKETDPRKWE